MASSKKKHKRFPSNSPSPQQGEKTPTSTKCSKSQIAKNRSATEGALHTPLNSSPRISKRSESSTKRSKKRLTDYHSQDRGQRFTPAKNQTRDRKEDVDVPDIDSVYKSAPETSSPVKSLSDLVRDARAEKKGKKARRRKKKRGSPQTTSSDKVDQDQDCDSNKSSKSSVSADDPETQRSPTPSSLSSPAKAKLNKAIAAHALEELAKTNSTMSNVLNARTPAKSLVGQMTPQTTTDSAKVKPTSKTKERKTNPEDLKTKDKTKDRTNRESIPSQNGSVLTTSRSTDETRKERARKRLQPDDAVIIKIPGSEETARQQKEEEAAVRDRIAQAYGQSFTSSRLKLQPMRTFSSRAFADSSDEESTPVKAKSNSEKKGVQGEVKPGNSAAWAEAQKQAEKLRNLQIAKLKSLSPLKSKSDSGKNDLAKVKTEKGSTKRKLDQREDGSSSVFQVKDQGSSSETPRKKRKRDRVSQNGNITANCGKDNSTIGQNDSKGNDGTEPGTPTQPRPSKDSPEINHKVILEYNLFESLKNIIPGHIYSKICNELLQLERSRVSEILERRVRKERKKAERGKIANLNWAEVDADLAIQHGLVEDAKDFTSKEVDVEVVVRSASKMISTLSEYMVMSLAAMGRRGDDGDKKSLKGVQDTLAAQSQSQLERLQGQVKNITEQVQKAK